MRGSQSNAVSALICLALAGGACDKSEAEREDLEAAAAAALGEGKDDKSKELEAKEAEARRKAFEERKQKEAEQKAKLDAIAARVVKAPDKPSKTLEKACDELVAIPMRGPAESLNASVAAGILLFAAARVRT